MIILLRYGANMKLYHFTNKENLKTIRPDFFGKNCYTRNDKNISSVKRAFYYSRPKAQEYLLSDASYRYTVNIDKKKIYNLTRDSKKYLVKNQNLDEVLRKIKKEYDGITYDCGFQCYCIFKPLTVKEVKVC